MHHKKQVNCSWLCNLWSYKKEMILISKSTYIFGHGSTRYMDSLLGDFIHGSSTTFENFNFTLGIQDCSLCRYCKTESDSPEHQLFYCTALEDPTRQKLLTIIDDTSQYIVDLVFSGCEHIHKLFYERISFINSITLDQEWAKHSKKFAEVQRNLKSLRSRGRRRQRGMGKRWRRSLQKKSATNLQTWEDCYR